METWAYYKDSKKGVGAYFVSNQGHVKFVSLKGRENILKSHWRETYDRRDNRTRRQYIVRIGDDKQQVNVLVARFFVPNPKRRRYIVHRDGNKENCAAENLKWGHAVTREEQIAAFAIHNKLESTSPHPDFEAPLVDYVLTRDARHLETAWMAGMSGLKTIIKGEIVKRRGFVADRTQIDDCLQETYLLLVESIESGLLRNPHRLWGYVVALAKFVTCKHGRENKHISVDRRNHSGDDYNLYDLEKYNDRKYAYTPAWGMF